MVKVLKKIEKISSKVNKRDRATFSHLDSVIQNYCTNTLSQSRMYNST